jgi:hypothetical protein
MDVLSNLSWKIILLPLVVLMTINWLAWIWGWGRFKRQLRDPAEPNDGTSPVESVDLKLRHAFAQFSTAIISEFRHLLALFILLMFATTMGLAMYPGLANKDIDGILKAVQAVAASLGGLLGSIIGYYFGESAASKLRQPGVGSK